MAIVTHIESVQDVRLTMGGIESSLAEVEKTYWNVANSVDQSAPSWRGEDRILFLKKMEQYSSKARILRKNVETFIEGVKKILDIYDRTSEVLSMARGL